MNGRNCDVEVFSRVTGFYRPVQSWNKGKASEFSERQRYDIKEEIREGSNRACSCQEGLVG